MGLLIIATLQNGSHKACEEWVGMNSCTQSTENVLQKKTCKLKSSFSETVNMESLSNRRNLHQVASSQLRWDSLKSQITAILMFTSVTHNEQKSNAGSICHSRRVGDGRW